MRNRALGSGLRRDSSDTTTCPLQDLCHHEFANIASIRLSRVKHDANAKHAMVDGQNTPISRDVDKRLTRTELTERKGQ